MSAALAPAFDIPHLPRASVKSRGRARARLTVRGRRVLLGFALVAVLATALAWSAHASSTSAESVTVQPGQTLSDVARERLPDVPTETAVAHLQLVNGLNSSQVSAGQRLVLPAE